MSSDAPEQHTPPPDEVFRLLPAYLESVEDLLSLRLVSKHHQGLVNAGTTGPVLLRLCYLSRRVCFRPSPLLLLAWLTPAIATWANRSSSNRDRLKAVIPLGADELLYMAVFTPAIAREAAWSFDKARAVTDWRQSTLEPVSDLVDRCVGEKWYGQEGFWDGAADDARTLAGDPDDAPLHLAIYGEMFGGAWDAWLEANAEREANETIDECIARSFARGLDSRDPLLPPLGRPSVRADLLKYVALDRELQQHHVELTACHSATQSASRRPAIVDPFIDDYPVSEVDTAEPMLSGSPSEEMDWVAECEVRIDTEPVTDKDPASESDQSTADRARRPLFPWRLSPLYLLRNERNTPYGGLIVSSDLLPPNRVDDQGIAALEHLLAHSPLWGRLMASIRSLAGGDFDDQPRYRAGSPGDGTTRWRQQLWEQCFYLLGLDGISIIAQMYTADVKAERDRLLSGQSIDRESYEKDGYLDTGSVRTTGPAWEKLRRWRSRIALLKVEPRTISVMIKQLYEVPLIIADLEMLCCSPMRLFTWPL